MNIVMEHMTYPEARQGIWRRLIKYTSLLAWVLWGLFSLYLLASSGEGLLVVYSAYWLVCAMVLVMTREDVLSPASVCVFVSFLSFGLNIPFIGAGLAKGITIPQEVLANVTLLVIFAVLAFVLGSSMYPVRLVPTLFAKRVHLWQERSASIGVFIVLLGAIAAAALVRIRFHLGEAGMQPAFPFAGYIQFVLFEGMLLLSLWFLAKSLQRGGVFIIYGLSLLLCIALTQALLGWRGAIFHMVLLGFGIFWYQRPSHGKKPISIAWLILLIMLAGSVLQLGNAVRAERLGGEVEFAETGEDFVTKLMTRSQGTTRLARVVEYFGELSSDNNQLIFTLIDKGISTTQYIDHKLYRVEGFQSHSVGTSGPGGPYTAMGVIGVAGAYFILGTIYEIFYVNALRLRDMTSMPAAMYIYLVFILILSMSENFSLLTVKMIFAVYAQAYCFDRFLLHSDARKPLVTRNAIAGVSSRAMLFNFK